MHNTLMFISSDIIAVSVSARTSAGIISGLFPCDVLGGGLVCWYDLRVCSRTASGVPGGFCRRSRVAVSAVSVTWLQTSAGFLSDFPAVSEGCRVRTPIDKFD